MDEYYHRRYYSSRKSCSYRIPTGLIKAAVAYYGEYRDEIDEEIEAKRRVGKGWGCGCCRVGAWGVKALPIASERSGFSSSE
jgi:hypothetical protein